MWGDDLDLDDAAKSTGTGASKLTPQQKFRGTALQFGVIRCLILTLICSRGNRPYYDYDAVRVTVKVLGITELN